MIQQQLELTKCPLYNNDKIVGISIRRFYVHHRKIIKEGNSNTFNYRIRAFNLKLYELLNVPEDATGSEILSSYTELIQKMKKVLSVILLN